MLTTTSFSTTQMHAFCTEWSAPSAIALGGLGGGFEIGVELTDMIIVLNSEAALTSFSKGGMCPSHQNACIS